MATNAYLTSNEVVSVPGRLQAFWQNMTSAMQNNLIMEASAKVDEILGLPDEGLVLQLGKTATVQVNYNRDTIFLPNKPINSVTSISVLPRSGGVYALPVRMTSTPGVPATVRLWGGQGLKFTGDPSGQVAIPSWGRAEVPFQEDDAVTVVYDCGYTLDLIPVAVRRATRLILSSMLFSEADNPSGAFHISQDHVSYSYGSGRGGEVNPVVDDAVVILQPYRLEVYSN